MIFNVFSCDEEAPAKKKLTFRVKTKSKKASIVKNTGRKRKSGNWFVHGRGKIDTCVFTRKN